MNNTLMSHLMKIQQTSDLKPWTEAQWIDYLALPTTKLYLDDQDCPHAYLIVQEVLPEIEIIEIVVDVTFQQKGIGLNLLQKLLEQAQKNEIHSIFLEVSAHNQKAINLYKKADFVQINTRPNYYLEKNGLKADAYVLVWYNKNLDKTTRN
jgi:[ribosomal protein S18]-alanine N-acetyltransferase